MKNAVNMQMTHGERKNNMKREKNKGEEEKVNTQTWFDPFHFQDL